MSERKFPPEVLEALRKGNNIEAIKLLRMATRTGLAEAKSVIDAMERHAPQAHEAADDRADHHPRIPPSAASSPPPIVVRPGLGPGEQPRSAGGYGFLILIGVAAIAWLAWKFG